jgi:hypothetical protein
MEETPITLPPEPEETGVKPDQRTPTVEETQALTPVIDGKGGALSQLSDRLGEIGESGIRGHAGSILLQACVAHLEGESHQLRRERDAAVNKAEQYKDQFHEEKERAAVLAAERDTAKTVTRLRNVLITVGGIIVSFGLRGFFETQQPVWTWPATIAGCVLLLAGWFWSDRRNP